jgi:hypothetical protein
MSVKQYPLVFAWFQRFNGAIKAAKAAADKPTTLKGAEAARRILSAKYAELEVKIDGQDPANLKQGDEVEVWPIDSGSRHHDRGTLVGINEEQIVLQLQAERGEQGLRLHFPRTNFRVMSVQRSESKL